MADQSQERTTERYSSDNSEYTSPSSLHYRLSPDETIMGIEKELRGGYHEIIINEDGNRETIFRKFGEPLLNDYGVQAIMRIVRSTINSSTVQGNSIDTEFHKFMKNFHQSLAIDLVTNFDIYGLKSSTDYHNIIQCVTGFAYWFLSRTINDGERETMKNISREMYRDGDNSQSTKKGFFGFK